MALNTPKRIKLFNTFVHSPADDQQTDWHDPFDDEASVNKSSSAVMDRSDTANSSNGNCNGNGSLSPASSCDSPEFSLRNTSNTSSNISSNSHHTPNNASADPRENRRGRPRSEALTTLMIEGSTSPSSIKCTFCNRVFPREKSLQAHLRTHTGQLYTQKTVTKSSFNPPTNFKFAISIYKYLNESSACHPNNECAIEFHAFFLRFECEIGHLICVVSRSVVDLNQLFVNQMNSNDFACA